MNPYTDTPTMDLSEARNSLGRCIARDVVAGTTPSSDMLKAFGLMDAELDARMRA